MEVLQLQPIETQLNNQNSVGAADTLTPVDSAGAANSSVGSSIQETQLGQSLDAALAAPAEPTAPIAPIALAEPVAPTEPAAPVALAEPAAPIESTAPVALAEPAVPAALAEPAAPVEPAPVVIAAPEPQAAAQEVQALNQEQAPSQAQAPTVSTPVGDTLSTANDPTIANSLQQNVAGSSTDALKDVIPGLDPTTTAAPPAAELQGFSVSNDPTKADDHDHGNPGSPPVNHISSLDDVASVKGVNAGATRLVKDLTRRFGIKGDLLDPGAGNNVVIGAGGNDLIFGDGGGLNTITTGSGADTIVLGDETTNRIFDFNPNRDRFVLSDGIDINNIVIGQGKNPGKGGLNQPLDSLNNTLIIDKSDGHILASLTFTKSDAITDKNFLRVGDGALDAAKNSTFSNNQEGNGQLTGGLGRDKLVGGDGDDFLAPGDDTFRFRTAKSGGEFPFANDSPGTTKLNISLKGGVFRIDGNYKDFDGAPLFSQGETTLDPTAILLNGAQAQPFIDGFLKVPNDVEGNKISGTHLHFSPAEDARGNFADATVVRYFTNTITDAKSGTISGEFELTPQEQAALLAGNLYANTHTNIDLDKDGKGGFPTGENRTNFNKNVVRFV